MNVKSQEDVLLAMKRNYAQVGALGGKKAKALLESSDDYEAWYPLPLSPGLTMLASDCLSEEDKNKLEVAITSIDSRVVEEMQQAFVSKPGKYVADKDAEFKTLLQAMEEAGYIESRKQVAEAR